VSYNFNSAPAPVHTYAHHTHALRSPLWARGQRNSSREQPQDGESGACCADTRAAVVSDRRKGPEAWEAGVQRGFHPDGQVSDCHRTSSVLCMHAQSECDVGAARRTLRVTQATCNSVCGGRRYKPTYDGGADVGDHVVVVNTKVTAIERSPTTSTATLPFPCHHHAQFIAVQSVLRLPSCFFSCASAALSAPHMTCPSTTRLPTHPHSHSYAYARASTHTHTHTRTHTHARTHTRTHTRRMAERRTPTLTRTHSCTFAQNTTHAHQLVTHGERRRVPA
jgi:hypothetical protein